MQGGTPAPATPTRPPQNKSATASLDSLWASASALTGWRKPPEFSVQQEGAQSAQLTQPAQATTTTRSSGQPVGPAPAVVTCYFVFPFDLFLKQQAKPPVVDEVFSSLDAFLSKTPTSLLHNMCTCSLTTT